MPPHRGFPPVANAHANVLILGTLPGPMSLQMQQYYAQPRNAFWPLMGALADAWPDLPYPERLARLQARRIALWDVCAAAERDGALDAAIVARSVVANDFAGFFAAHPQVKLIGFNGATAARLYARHVGVVPDGVRTVTLPSTSPAFASMPVAEKLGRWREELGQPRPKPLDFR